MRRVALFTTLLLLTAACGDDGGSDDGASALDLAAAATGAQQAIDLGDDLGTCPWDQPGVVAAVGAVVDLVPEAADFDDNYGQVFSGGEVDITYCEFWVSSSAATGIREFRVDVHPGTADLQTYLDEEWGGDAAEAATTSKLAGGTVRSWCLADDQCIAAWQGDGLFVALVISSVATATAEDAVTAVTAALPVVVTGLATP
jgi:hypothetical protein